MVTVTDQVNSRVRDIIMTAPYYGLIMSSVNRHIGNKTLTGGVPVETAGVYKSGINQFMVINPEYFQSLNQEEQRFLLMHELLHICFLHPIVGPLYPNKELFNIAADIEINYHVSQLDQCQMPEGGMHLEMFGLTHNDGDKGTKWYYDYLNKEMNNNTGIGQKIKDLIDIMSGNHQNGQGISLGPNGELLDNHGSWKEFESLSESEKRMIEAQTIKQAARALEGNSKHMGNLPGTLRGMIDSLMNPKPTYNWKALFRKLYTGYADTTYMKKTRKKESIRFAGMPAIKVKRHSRVLCAIDTSGSISKDELMEFFNEVEGMRQSGVEIIVAECDTRIPRDGIYKYKNLNTIKNRNITGGGGTSFEEPIRYLNEKSNMFNMLIYLTDGYASVPRVKSTKPIVWVLSRRGYDLESFVSQGFPGYTIKIKDE